MARVGDMAEGPGGLDTDLRHGIVQGLNKLRHDRPADLDQGVAGLGRGRCIFHYFVRLPAAQEEVEHPLGHRRRRHRGGRRRRRNRHFLRRPRPVIGDQEGVQPTERAHDGAVGQHRQEPRRRRFGPRPHVAERPGGLAPVLGGAAIQAARRLADIGRPDEDRPPPAGHAARTSVGSRHRHRNSHQPNVAAIATATAASTSPTITLRRVIRIASP